MPDFQNLPAQSLYKGFLQSRITSTTQTTGIIVLPVITGTIAGTQRMTLLNTDSPEAISFTGQTATGELTGVTRGLPLGKDGG